MRFCVETWLSKFQCHEIVISKQYVTNCCSLFTYMRNYSLLYDHISNRGRLWPSDANILSHIGGLSAPKTQGYCITILLFQQGLPFKMNPHISQWAEKGPQPWWFGRKRVFNNVTNPTIISDLTNEYILNKVNNTIMTRAGDACTIIWLSKV